MFYSSGTDCLTCDCRAGRTRAARYAGRPRGFEPLGLGLQPGGLGGGKPGVSQHPATPVGVPASARLGSRP